MNIKSLGVIVLAFGAGAVVSSQPAQAAFGFCSQPFAPTMFLTKPTKPVCAMSRNCSAWEVQNYRNDIDTYFDRLKKYARGVDDYYTDAQSYIKCMADLD